MDKKFEDWVRKKHLEKCSQCKKEGKTRLIDSDAYAVYLFKEFYREIRKR